MGLDNKRKSQKQPTCITEVSITSNPAWKITNDVSEQALEDAAIRIAIQGGDVVPGRDSPSKDRVLINLRSNVERGTAPSLFAPVASFGEFHVIDREEIESYRSIRQLLEDYLFSAKEGRKANEKPRSFAVFGPPGSGKSYGITEVAKSVMAAAEIKSLKDPMVFNLAQFSRAEELSRAFLEVVSETALGNTPLVFFDEFDCALDGQELGWLRYFLAPLQDGEFFFDGKKQQIGRALFVFAGGTSFSFRRFSREEGSTEQERFRFVQAKGPDFLSRLSGHIDVLGVNRREDSPDQSYLLRRALIIRSELRKQGKLGRSDQALVDVRFIYKLLRVGKFKHGARSITKLLEMCIGIDGMLHLPPADQLAMHMDKSDVENLVS